MTYINEYIEQIIKRYETGISREHSYRGDLQNLLAKLAPGVLVTNEPTRVACGAPDYIITKKNIPIGFIEAKDIGKSLDKKEYKEQFDRYRKSLDNLIITDYLDFRLYVGGEFKISIKIAKLINGKIIPETNNFDQFANLIREFCAYVGQTIKSSSKLSKMMAGKARLLSQIIENALTGDEESAADSTLKDQMKAFKDILIHDIKTNEFADIYAQTIAYGMFAARLHDPTLEDFSRQEAAELIPKSNPFLRKLFQYIAGYDLDDRIRWIVDALAEIFQATDVAALLNNFGKATEQNDPIIHFYETFLAEYDPKLRKSRGVWYTPEPVVNFIVRAVDDILKTEFDLSKGLAETSKTTIEIDSQVKDKRSKTGYKRIKKEVHRVQILDPATGTGTFLAEVVKHIYKDFKGQEGIWSKYVEEHLVPRLNGFEILMASYAMAHLKLDLLLTKTGFKPKKEERLRIFLTNSLEEHHPDTGTLFASWLSNEASEANYIKRDTPVMVVLGNPPYSVSSSNKGDWIKDLIADYKKNLKEKKLNLDDDYIKFIRYGEHFIEKNGEGILGYISNNSFIDGVTHRQMRRHLLETFDKIYILDLHGSSKKKETCPDGSKDENVFDIQQGVSVNLFLKNNKKSKGHLAEVMHSDLYGLRNEKYKELFANSIASINWTTLDYKEPNYFFSIKDYESQEIYEQGIKLTDLFLTYNSGIQTKRDNLTIQNSISEIEAVISDLKTLDTESIRIKYDLPQDGRDWKVEWAIKDIQSEYKIIPISYRPFDTRFTAYTGNSKGFIAYPRTITTKDLIRDNNYAIVFERFSVQKTYSNLFVSNNAIDLHVLGTAYANGYTGSIYTYPESDAQQALDGKQERTPNLDMNIVKEIASKLGLTFTPEEENKKCTFAPIDILDYIYAVLHSPAYREKYKEFLKIDFPRVPYPKDKRTFWQMVKLGGEIREIHLLESPVVEKPITTYPEDGDNMVTRSIGKKDFVITDKDKGLGRVRINEDQYFDNIPVIAWDFYIGGYQPAQKWLKDRKGRTLSFEDIQHYQKIIVALSETDRIMKEIDSINKI